MAAIEETYPLARARAAEIEALEQWAVRGAKPASRVAEVLA